ncbi:MAG: aldehyde dehydrogenase family protein, partial [Bacteroidota bacterium]
MPDTLYDRHRELLERAARAIGERTFYTPYPEHHSAYPEAAWHAGKVAFEEQLGKRFEGLLQPASKRWVGGETSPYTAKALGIAYPCASPDELVGRAEEAWKSWRQVPVTARAGLLAESLERLRERFFAMAYATMHTTGQSFMMAFQASGPHACDRAMEAVALGLQEMTRFPAAVDWEKPVGKSTIRLAKRFKPVPRGIGLVIGCSTFPVWNSVPGLYANLMAGNPVIVKPHPGAVLPIALVVAELQQLLHEQQLDPLTVQLAADSADEPLAKALAQH